MPRTIGRTTAGVVAAVTAAGVLAGCGGQSAGASGDRDFRVKADRLDPSAFPTYGAPAPAVTPSVAPTPATCPRSGVVVSTGVVDTAMGRRATVVELKNCGARPYDVNGYPRIGALDENREALDLTITHDHPYTDAGRDQGPRPLTLAPGQSVKSVLNWNNRVTSFDPVTEGAYLVVTPRDGETPQTLPFRLDIGTSGELDVTAWARDLLG
ncbi:UNVERIFIED_CONTAM: hypothetical protein RKD43_001544 [Streptomyces graminofaciens]